jgi:hypothetical protein
MQDAHAAMNRGRGTDLILAHCGALTRWDDVRPPAFVRLERALGQELARLLVAGLAAHDLRMGWRWGNLPVPPNPLHWSAFGGQAASPPALRPSR